LLPPRRLCCGVHFAPSRWRYGGCWGCYSTGSGNDMAERYLFSVETPRVFGFVPNSSFDASGCGGGYSVKSDDGTTKNPFLHAGSGGGSSAIVVGLPVWSFFYRSLDGGDSFMVVCVFFFRVVACRGFAGPGEWFCSSRLVVVGRCAADSREPMAVFAYRVPPAAYQGWMSAPRVGKVMNGVLKIGCHCPVATIPEEEGKQ